MTAERERPRAFRRRQFVAPHRRRRLIFRLLKPFAAALVVVGVPVGIAVWILESPVFSVREISVAGTERVSQDWVRQALAPLRGRHLLRVRLADIERRLREHRWIRGVTARKELPHHLAVELTERLPAALLRQADGLHYVDAEGFVVAAFEPRLGGADLPQLDGIEDPAAEVPRLLALAERWRRLRPGWQNDLSEIVRLGVDDYRVFAADVPFAVRLGDAGSEVGLERMAALLPRLDGRFGEIAELDLRFSRQVVIKSAALPRSQEG